MKKNKMLFALAILVIIFNYILMWFYRPKIEIKVVNNSYSKETVLIEKTTFPVYNVRRKIPLLDE